MEVGKLPLYTGHYEDALLAAMENDTVEVIEMIIKKFPQSISIRNDEGHTIFQLSIMNRCEKVYNLLVYKTRRRFLQNSIIDENGNNLLHLAGKLAPQHRLNDVSSAALQMQRELQWFQEVRRLLGPEEKGRRNKYNQTPLMVFQEEHRNMRYLAEDWMKKTADSYTIIATLIITIVFASTITLPGGNNGETGQAIYRNRLSFIVFIVSDVISMFTSTASLLLLISIPTSAFNEMEFLYKLPARLMQGLVLLFMSVISMMIAFSTSVYIMFEQDKPWVLIPIVALTCIPIASFITLQLPLLVDLITSTYGRGIFRKSDLEWKLNSFLL